MRRFPLQHQGGLRVLSTAALVLLLPLLAGCSLLTPLPAPVTLEQRLAMLPASGPGLEAPVTIRWNAHQVPFVEATSDADAAFALGVVQAHLRLGQMEIARRVARGRISEMAGPFTTDIDAALRTLDFAAAAPAIETAMPPATRTWVARFVDGINHVLATADPLPHEFATLALEREPWTVADVLAIGRLGGTDVNWLAWFDLLPHRGSPDWPMLLAETLEAGTTAPASAAPRVPRPDAPAAARQALGQLLNAHAKTGSNSVAVAARRSATGGALIASDPHLGVSVPNIWVMAGVRTPTLEVVGLMPAGLPVFALGRTRHIAWGGTNMRGAASDLVDISIEDPARWTVREERIAVRGWIDDSVTIRISDQGPVISDRALVPAPAGTPLALRWMGHQPTDEISALLAAARAPDGAAFRQALAGFGVSPQNMVWADADGHVGLVAAGRLPRRPAGQPTDLISSPAAADAAWADPAGTLDLPGIVDPPDGVVLSANNPPGETPFPISYFFSAPDRMIRLAALTGATDALELEDLKRLQQDVLAPGTLALRDALTDRVPDVFAAEAGGAAGPLIRDWNGRYTRDSAGALAMEGLIAALIEPLTAAGAAEGRFAATLPPSLLPAALLRRVEALPDPVLAALLPAALKTASDLVEDHGTWGTVHRLRLEHPLARVPVLGGAYRLADVAWPGSRETVMKAAHGPVEGIHSVRYGAQARHISDMADPDANWFLLMTGQDGWLSSDTALDQLSLWQRGEMIRLPLTPDAVTEGYPHVTVLRPS